MIGFTPFHRRHVYLTAKQAEEIAAVLDDAYSWIRGVRETGDGWADGDDIYPLCGKWASVLYRWARKTTKPRHR